MNHCWKKLKVILGKFMMLQIFLFQRNAVLLNNILKCIQIENSYLKL